VKNRTADLVKARELRTGNRKKAYAKAVLSRGEGDHAVMKNRKKTTTVSRSEPFLARNDKQGGSNAKKRTRWEKGRKCSAIWRNGRIMGGHMQGGGLWKPTGKHTQRKWKGIRERASRRNGQVIVARRTGTGKGGGRKR